MMMINESLIPGNSQGMIVVYNSHRFETSVILMYFNTLSVLKNDWVCNISR